MAAIARDEEAWWQAELARLAPQMLLPGRPARGGGRAAGGGLAAGLALEVSRLAALAPAHAKTALAPCRRAVWRCTRFCRNRSVAVAGSRRPGRTKATVVTRFTRRADGAGAEAEVEPESAPKDESAEAPYTVQIPGEIDAPVFGLTLRIEIDVPTAAHGDPDRRREPLPTSAILRNWKPGDRVRLRYSGGLRKVKEVLERLRVTGTDRALWPVLEVNGRIVWMRGVDLEPEPGMKITAVLADGSAPSLPL